MGRTQVEWIELGKHRILSILNKYRVSYTRHLEIKISEAGPNNQRVEPALLSIALRQLKRSKLLPVLQKKPFEAVGAPDYGKPGDQGKLQKLNRIHSLFINCSQHSHLCGWQLEKLIYDTVLNQSIKEFTVIGSGPFYQEGILVKPGGSEVNFYEGKQAYGGAGFDLFMQHKNTGIPIGIEAKNIREWIYPASVEVWRMIARACTFECLPVLAARKISYITTAGLFSQFGIMGFQTQFQYWNPGVRSFSKYKFNDVLKTDGLGFADIKITDDIPPHFNHYFTNILPKEVKTYYDRFMSNRKLLMKYAIKNKLAEDNLSSADRMLLYETFKEESQFADPDFEDGDDQE